MTLFKLFVVFSQVARLKETYMHVDRTNSTTFEPEPIVSGTYSTTRSAGMSNSKTLAANASKEDRDAMQTKGF
jgi:hypothetical protein